MAIPRNNSDSWHTHNHTTGPGRKFRLFVGNLSETVKQEELREKFELLLKTSYQDGIRVGNVEVRCKNEDNYFGFVDVHCSAGEGPPPLALCKVIELMNNTKWKGALIKVQLAKESFLDKLKREREGGGGGAVAGNNSPAPPKPQQQPFNRFPKKPENFDFEIVSNSSAQKPIRRDGGDGSEEEEGEEDYHEDGIPRFRGLGAFGFGTTPTTETPANEIEMPPSITNIPSRILNLNPKSSSDAPKSVSEEDKSRFERFQRIAGYPVQAGGGQQQQNNNARLLKPQIINPSPIKPPISTEQPKGVVFRKHKQENSDLLRQQSLGKMQDVKMQQHNIIKSSLAQSAISNKFEEENPLKKPKFSLFGDDQEEEDGTEFKLKKQYEGAEGQRLLELRGQWAFDERFTIDDRFKGEENNAENLETDEEKRRQMSILSDVLGTSIQPMLKSSSDKGKDKPSVLVKRYDPDNEPDIPIEEKQSGKIQKEKVKNVPIVEEPVAALIRTTEAATYKTVSNLKSLFSSEDTQTQKNDTGFSLLATFGHTEVDHKINTDEVSFPASAGAPRQFWQSNPFKYDSSDDEDEDQTGTNKKKKVQPNLALIPKCDFFFKKNDQRFSGLEDYFLKKDEMDERIDYNEKRRELRSIVKAKARNAKRKDEKRTLAIKRAIRKKKMHRKKAFKTSSSNSVKIGA